jgi:hypothetical protein
MTAASHCAVVGSLAYRERLKALPSSFDATLALEPENRYFLQAVAVHGPAGKVGYLAPEAVRSRYDAIKAALAEGVVTCRAQRTAAPATSQGAVEIFVDLSAFPIAE